MRGGVGGDDGGGDRASKNVPIAPRDASDGRVSGLVSIIFSSCLRRGSFSDRIRVSASVSKIELFCQSLSLQPNRKRFIASLQKSWYHPNLSRHSFVRSRRKHEKTKQKTRRKLKNKRANLARETSAVPQTKCQLFNQLHLNASFIKILFLASARFIKLMGLPRTEWFWHHAQKRWLQNDCVF